MDNHVELQQIDDVPTNSQVAHYDELAPRAKDQLFELVEKDTPSLQKDAVDELENHDIVKFTDYYRVSVC